MSANFNHEIQVLINGSSMSGSGFNRKEIENITGKNVASYIYEGVSVHDRYEMISHFFNMYPDGIETVIYEINPVLLSGMKTSENTYTHFYPFMDDKTISDYIKRNSPHARDYLIHKYLRTTRFESRSFVDVISGYLNFSGNIKTNTLDTTLLRSLVSERGQVYIEIKDADRKVFEETMYKIREHKSNVILVMMPIYYLKLQTYNSESYNDLCRYFNDFSLGAEGVSFIDLNQDSLIFNPRYFSDLLHFNVYGQQQITQLISKYLMCNFKGSLGSI